MEFEYSLHSSQARPREHATWFGRTAHWFAGVIRGMSALALAALLFVGLALIAVITFVIFMLASLMGAASRAVTRTAQKADGSQVSDGDVIDARQTARGWMVDPRRP